MLAEQLGETAELQDREVELLQRRLQRLRLLGEQVVDRRHRVLQGQEQLLRRLVVGLVVVRLGLGQFVPGTLDALQRFPQGLRGGFAHTEEIALVEFGGIHPPAALHQVVRLVHQYRHPPLVDLGQAMEHGAEIEVVVVVAHRQVAPARQFLAQVVGTDPVRQRHLAQPRLVQPARLHGGGAGRRQAFVEALGQGTGLAVAGLVRVLAGLVPRHQFQHPHRQSAGLPFQATQGMQREGPARGLGGQEEQPVQALPGHRLELREQRADGLADPGRRLGHQATTGGGGLVHRLRQLPLAVAEFGVGKA
ncbi:hypothetical protein PAERUG_E15_London_28_01_14_08690 [Pseudomonas aeruginosa]|nr:hypothetical protein PAERUG_E15_London_28_01_14_08690 [Pseudomonas aeruginosa]